MYNANLPSPEELPSSARLLRSTIIAILAAAAILVTIVLPAEYGIDPTRIGRMLGLAQMGEIKAQLAEEAEADRLMEARPAGGRSNLLDRLLGAAIGSAHAQTAPAPWRDTVTVTLSPGQGTEVKLAMQEGAVAEYRWRAEGGVVNFDLHGDGGGREISYERARFVPGDEGSFKAAFPGDHGWFWRNRDKGDVTVTLQVRGDYSAIKRSQ